MHLLPDLFWKLDYQVGDTHSIHGIGCDLQYVVVSSVPLSGVVNLASNRNERKIVLKGEP